MKMLTRIALTLPLAIGSAAFAADATGSQFEHQTDSGKLEITPAVTFGSIKYNYQSNNPNGWTTATDSVYALSVGGEYGISDMFSVGLRIGYQNDNYSYNNGFQNIKGDGMVDPDIYLNGRAAMGADSSLRFGAHLSFSLAPSNAGTEASFNEYSGGITFTPFVGYEMGLGGGTGGARISYDLVQTDRSINVNGNSDKIQNGNAFTGALFYEMNWQPVLVGIDLGMVNHQANKYKPSSGSTFSMNNGFNNFKADIYVAWTVAQDITILPTLSYGVLTTGADNGVQSGYLNSANGVYGTVAARFGF